MVTAAESQGLSPGYKFDPTDEMLVEHYLLPYIRGEGLPLAGVVFVDDPRSLPPWILLDRHGLGGDGDGVGAYFIAPAAAAAAAGRQSRSVAGGGRWVKQQRAVSEGTVVFGGETFRWEKSSLNFHRDADRRSGSTGWVMNEIAVVPPPGSAVAATHRARHIAFTGHGQNRKRVPDGYVVAGVNQEYAFVPEQHLQSSQDYFLQEPLADSDSKQFLDQEQSNQDQEYDDACYIEQNQQCFVPEQQQQINQHYFPEAEQSNRQFLDQEQSNQDQEQSNQDYFPEAEQSNQQLLQALEQSYQEECQQGCCNQEELGCCVQQDYDDDLERFVFQGDLTQWQQPDGLGVGDGGGVAVSWREYMDEAEMQKMIDGLLAD